MHAYIENRRVELNEDSGFMTLQANVEASRASVREVAERFKQFQADNNVRLDPNDAAYQTIEGIAQYMIGRSAPYFSALLTQTVGVAKALEEAGDKAGADNLRHAALSSASLALPLFTDCVGFVAMHANQPDMPNAFVDELMGILAEELGVETKPAAANLN